MESNIKPITPDEVIGLKKDAIPSQVFEVFNGLIAKNWNGYSAIVKQKDAACLIAEKLNIEEDVVYKNLYLDVEEIYKEAGWLVIYNRPAYCEDFDATFEFRKKK